jgi:hypothetical protein
LIIKAGMKVQCSQGHVCGEVTADIDTDQGIVVPVVGRSPFKIDQTAAVADLLTGTWRCGGCGEVVVRGGPKQQLCLRWGQPMVLMDQPIQPCWRVCSIVTTAYRYKRPTRQRFSMQRTRIGRSCSS